MKKLCRLSAVLLAFVIVAFFASCDLINPVNPNNPPGPGTGLIEQDEPPVLDYFYTVEYINADQYNNETLFPTGYPISVHIGGTTFANDVPKYAITLKSGGTVVDSIVGTLDNPIAKWQASFFYQLISIHSISTAGSYTAEVSLEDSEGNKSNTLTTVITVIDEGYVTVWQNPQEKQINSPEGTKTVALLATGNHCDVWLDITVSQPTELRLWRIVFSYDNDYERVTSFLGLYESGGGPGGDGGGDNIPRIQVYLCVLNQASGYADYGNGENVYINVNINGNDFSSGLGGTFTHELCHLIFFGNLGETYYPDSDPETWYIEFLPIMAEIVFLGGTTGSPMPNVELFENWEYVGWSSGVYYTLYFYLSEFLVEKYGNSIFYDLFHELPKGNINKQALQNVLGKRGSTISAMEAEFAAWCNNRGTQG